MLNVDVYKVMLTRTSVATHDKDKELITGHATGYYITIIKESLHNSKLIILNFM